MLNKYWDGISQVGEVHQLEVVLRLEVVPPTVHSLLPQKYLKKIETSIPQAEEIKAHGAPTCPL